MKRWTLPEADLPAARELARACRISELCGRILLARGVSTPQQAAAFLSDGPGALHDPFLMRDMEKAVAAIEHAMREGELIVVYGDYDADGITATVLLYRYLEEAGARVAYYIPDREEEGYGLNRGACDALAESGAGLVVTVDNGVTAYDEIDYLNALGIRTVVTDHHEPRETLPNAEAVLNPHRADDEYPYRELSGVGVAFKLVCALEGDAEGTDTLERLGDLVCIGTVADVVPLTGENRALVRAGLRRMRETENPGVAALLAVAGFTGEVRAQGVAFGVAPRLNAASRMGQCDKSVELMLCDDGERAAVLAGEIDGCNRARKSLEGAILADIAAQLEENPALRRSRVIVLSGEGWHRGVIGIVASRVVERYDRPCVLISSAGEEARGSARSVEGFSIVGALAACGGLLLKYGGHTMAAGFSLKTGDIGALREALNAHAAGLFPEMPVPALALAASLTPADLDLGAAESLDALEPFGAGNESPVLAIRRARIDELVSIGEGKHLRVRFTFGGRTASAVCFGMTPERFPAAPGEEADLAVQLSVSEYQGARRLSLKIQDARPAPFDQEAYFHDLACCERLLRGEPVAPADALRLMPDRAQLAAVYRAVRATGELTADPDALALRVGRGALSSGQMRVAVEALTQAGLVAKEQGKLRLLPASGKVDLSRTPVLAALAAAGGGQ